MTPYAQIASWLAGAKAAVAFTGAGISTESGIPDFRSPGGIWAQAQPVYYQDFLSDAAARYEYWRQKCIAGREFAAAAPNAGHIALAQWQAAGKLRAVITQNIDELHQQAGSNDVIELHGTARQIACLDCAARFPAAPLEAEFLASDAVPACPACGGMLKHATISFGQSLLRDVLWQATRLSKEADVFLVLGSSLVVHPAASLPQLARQNGARVAIISRDETPLDDLADVVLHEPLGQALGKIDAALNPRTSAT